MRQVIDLQQHLFGQNIAEIEFDLKSRDEIPKLLMGLQHIYKQKELRDEVFSILKEMIPPGIDLHNGRPGMDLWEILVLGALRLNNNWNFDKVKEMTDQHMTIRQMLGLTTDSHSRYHLQTIKDNVSLFTKEVLNRINQVVVKAGHRVIGIKEGEALKGKADSFVLETNVHYPTDINLLFDAMRKVVTLVAYLCADLGISAWRKSHDNLLTIKELFNAIRRLNHSTSKNEAKKVAKADEILAAYRAYIEVVLSFIKKARLTLADLRKMGGVNEKRLLKIEEYISDAEKQIDQIERRIFNGETIPHAEKIFSIFEKHTEWISKGKAGVPQELGVRVAILHDQHGFILHHRVMFHETDDKVAVPMVTETLKNYPALKSCSFDKGFYSPENKRRLGEVLDLPVLPKKGRLTLEEKEFESSEGFVKARRNHPAVESAINALENHGLDRCPDHGVKGFERYVALSVLGRNLQILGHLIQQKEIKSRKRKEKYRQTWAQNRIAA